MHEGTGNFFFFFSEASPLSNWHMRGFYVKGIYFNCTEQFLMYCKAKLMGDEEIAAKILLADHPRDQKALGRQVRRFNGALWDQKREHYDFMGKLHQMQQHPDMAEYLLNTGDLELVEAARHDRIWGVGLDANSPAILHKKLWLGLNLHGKALMRVREELRKAWPPEPVI